MAADQQVRTVAPVWDIATPTQPSRLPGVTMAGFRQSAAGRIDLTIVPYPAVTVGIDLAGSMTIDDNGRRARDSVVLGIGAGKRTVRGTGIEVLQVRLSPVVAQTVLGRGAGADGSVLPLDELWGDDARRLRERLAEAVTWDDRFAIAETALARRLHPSPTTDPEVAYGWSQIVGQQGQVRVDEIAAAVGWSRKRLWSRFRAQVGATPKHAARLVRFDHAAHRLAGGDRVALVAAESGYADQSHLHREAIDFAGVTPTALAGAPWLAVDDVAWPTGDIAVAA